MHSVLYLVGQYPYAALVWVFGQGASHLLYGVLFRDASAGGMYRRVGGGAFCTVDKAFPKNINPRCFPRIFLYWSL
jgi:hypothetical protein